MKRPVVSLFRAALAEVMAMRALRAGVILKVAGI
jgi:hypothetical protein